MTPSHQALLTFKDKQLTFLAAGKSGMVYGTDDGRVLKEYYADHEDEIAEIDVERRAFARLGSHANIVRFLGARQDRSIVLERGQALRTVLQQASVNPIPLDRKFCWLRDAAEGLRYMHQNGIIHADVGCNNMIIVQDCLKLIDFEGCSIDGEQATSCYEWFSYRYRPAREISQKTDIFAYGCAIYEVMTGKPPHHELMATLSRDEWRQRVVQLYAEGQFPEVTGLPLGEVMQRCWHGTFDSMSEVLRALETTTCRSQVELTLGPHYRVS